MLNLQTRPSLVKTEDRLRENAHLPSARGKIAISSQRGDHFGKP